MDFPLKDPLMNIDGVEAEVELFDVVFVLQENWMDDLVF